MPEYIPWYHPGSELLRCLLCGALLVSGDTDIHTAFHERVGL